MKKISLSLLLGLLYSVNVFAMDVETEPNNQLSDADPITPGALISGQISQDFEKDWFFFEIAESDVLTVSIVDARYEIAVFDIDSNLLYKEILRDDGTVGPESDTSGRIGLGAPGQYFLRVTDSELSRVTGSYQLLVNLENQQPFDEPLSCPANPTFSGTSGILNIPAVDVNDTLGGFVTYEARLKLVPSIDGLLFEVLEASVK